MASYNFLCADAGASSDESFCGTEDAQQASLPPSCPAALAGSKKPALQPAPTTPEAALQLEPPSPMSAVGSPALGAVDAPVDLVDLVDLELPVMAAQTPKLKAAVQQQPTPKTGAKAGTKSATAVRRPFWGKSAASGASCPQSSVPSSSASGKSIAQAGGSDKKLRAARGSVGTFAGRRPPKGKAQLELFLMMKKEYEADVATRRAGGAPLPKKGSMAQEAYWAHLMKHMKQQAEGSQQEKFQAAVAAWRRGERAA